MRDHERRAGEVFGRREDRDSQYGPGDSFQPCADGPICQRYERPECGAPVFVVSSDVYLERVGVLCALEAYTMTEMLEPIVGVLQIGCVQ